MVKTTPSSRRLKGREESLLADLDGVDFGGKRRKRQMSFSNFLFYFIRHNMAADSISAKHVVHMCAFAEQICIITDVNFTEFQLRIRYQQMQK